MSDKEKDQIVKILFKGRRIEFYRNVMEFPVKNGDKLIVETDRGEDLGIAIVNEDKELTSMNNNEPRILRRATDKDLAKNSQNRKDERLAEEYCAEQADNLGLEMNMVDVEFRLDRKKMIFYFTADGRVDFRELVKILARKYKTRIEMRQINHREKMRRYNSIGPCGLPLCCQRFLDGFKPVKTQLVKDQNLPMNPSKISGVCGKLKCCFRYEYDKYKNFLSQYPEYGVRIKVNGKSGTLEKIDIFQEIATLRFDNDELKDITLEELRKFHRPDKN
ncbi:MAG TPA: regulatory iron-sulfur-containing complex subunit RicT [bacterium]|nr:regulatory iron-sulfur-containing complex subunit RicT [bacterium]